MASWSAIAIASDAGPNPTQMRSCTSSLGVFLNPDKGEEGAGFRAKTLAWPFILLALPLASRSGAYPLIEGDIHKIACINAAAIFCGKVSLLHSLLRLIVP